MCEVSADAPSFATHMRTGDLNVYVPPAEKPKITGLKSTYRSGEYVRANCSSNMSFPAAKLQWKINGFPVYPGEAISYDVTKTLAGEGKKQQTMESSTMGLHFLISHEHFNEVGKIKVQCIATLFDGVYEAETIQYIEAIDPHFNDDDNDVHYSFIHDKNGSESSLVQSSRKLFLLLFCNLVIGLLLSRSNCMFSSANRLRRPSSSSSNKKTNSGNISSSNNQSASLIGLDDLTSLSSLPREKEDYGNFINDNSASYLSCSSFATVTTLKQS
ncbi:uncharacterized protein LOC134835469 [Culicoides brevitarsis]|uniref:uncharacterized protein LOC134835469 n=1 Tax=Culicoides brevitarsis TaxID=469753 RepID=UPI00307B33CE